MVYACFADQGGPIRRGPAQSSAFPRFFALSAETGAGARHRAESGRIQTPDHGWLSMTSSSGFEASPETYLSQLPDRRNEQFTIYAMLVRQE